MRRPGAAVRPVENIDVRCPYSGYDPAMCVICIEFDKNAMTAKEARRALGEMSVKLDPAHVKEVEAKLADAERESEPPSTAKPTP